MLDNERYEVLKDYLTLAAGGVVEDPHPTAQRWAADGVKLPSALVRVGLIDNPDPESVTRAWTGSDMPFLSEQAFSTALNTGVQPSFLGYRDVCQTVDLTDYRSSAIYTVEQGTVEPQPDVFAADTVPLVALGNYESGRVYRYLIDNVLARPLVINGSLTAMAAILRASQLALYRTEAAGFAATVEANPTLQDGDTWFNTSNSTTGSLDASGLNAAFNLLSSQEVVSGTPSGALPYAIVTPPELFMSGAVNMEAIGNRVKLIVCPFLTSPTTYYAFAAPSEMGAIVRLRFDGQDAPQVEAARTPINWDGQAWRVYHHFGFKPVSRFGVARIEAA